MSGAGWLTSHNNGNYMIYTHRVWPPSQEVDDRQDDITCLGHQWCGPFTSPAYKFYMLIQKISWINEYLIKNLPQPFFNPPPKHQQTGAKHGSFRVRALQNLGFLLLHPKISVLHMNWFIVLGGKFWVHSYRKNGFFKFMAVFFFVYSQFEIDVFDLPMMLLFLTWFSDDSLQGFLCFLLDGHMCKTATSMTQQIVWKLQVASQLKTIWFR